MGDKKVSAGSAIAFACAAAAALTGHYYEAAFCLFLALL